MNLSAKAAAERAGVSVSLVYLWCKDGVLKHSRFGRPGRRGCIRIAPADLEAFLKSCEQSPAPLPAPLKHVTPRR